MNERNRDYRVVIERLDAADGGVSIAVVPDLPGCMSDGASREEAARNVADAIELMDQGGRPPPTRVAGCLAAPASGRSLTYPAAPRHPSTAGP